MYEQKIDTVENEPVIATDTEVIEPDTINSNETVIIEEVESTLVDAEVGETLPEELPEVTTISDEVTDTTE